MHNLKGASLMVLSMACFALMDMFVKLLSADLPPGEILAIMGAGGAIGMALLLIARGEAPMTARHAARRRGAQVGIRRAASLTIVFALSLVPLSLFTTIIQANPLLVTLGAALFSPSPSGGGAGRRSPSVCSAC